MIEAGINELALFDSADRGEWIVDAVYRAMAKAASRHITLVRPGTLSCIAQKSLTENVTG
jgi:hypothetical protein